MSAPLDLDALEALETAATPAPWVVGRFGCVKGGPFIEYARGSSQPQVALLTGGEHVGPEEVVANQNLVVTMRNALPALLEEVRRLRGVEAERDVLRTALEKAVETLEGWIPPAPDHSCGSPHASCDGACMDHAYASRAIGEFRAALRGAE